MNNPWVQELGEKEFSAIKGDVHQLQTCLKEEKLVTADNNNTLCDRVQGVEVQCSQLSLKQDQQEQQGRLENVGFEGIEQLRPDEDTTQLIINFVDYYLN